MSSYYYGIDTSLLKHKDLKYFIKWYLDGADPKEFKKWGSLGGDMKFCIENYSKRPDVIAAIVDYTKRNAKADLIKVYNVMLKNALEGDVQSANWLINFSKSDFFVNNKEENELEEFVKGLTTDE